MARIFQENKLLIASSNKGKIAEINDLLKAYNICIVPIDNFSIEVPEETGSSFIDNAILKAKYYCKHTGLPSLADDSGLAVSALGGEPGIYSARWAKNGNDFNYAMERVRKELETKNATDYSAKFVCALALCWPDMHTECVAGEAIGTLSFPPRGEHGFGYDPIFVPKGMDKTFAQMSKAEKQQISHRSDAFNKLIVNCFPKKS